MKRTLKAHWPFLLIWIALSLFSVVKLAQIPFHPDETTYIYMSQDFEGWLSNPLALAWDPEEIGEPRQRYRAIDPPLSRYYIGLGRSLFRVPALEADWDWTKSWAENQRAGALPDTRLLVAARFSIAALVPFSLLLIYRAGIQLGGKTTGVIASLIIGCSGLTQLHARRAMTEGPLMFGLALLIYAIIHPRPRGWLIGLALAMAVNAKHSAAALVPVGLLAAAWIPDLRGRPSRDPFINVGIAGAVLFFLTAALNPFTWKEPLEAVRWGLEERVDFLEGQAAEFSARNPEIRLDSFSERVIGAIAQVYYLPLSFAEAGNYRSETAASEASYLEETGRQLLRGPIWGTTLLILSLFGLTLGGVDAWKRRSEQTRSLVICLAATFLLVISTLAVIQLPFQRFYYPFLVFSGLWTAYGLARVLSQFLGSTGQSAAYRFDPDQDSR